MSKIFDSLREGFPRARTMAYFDNASSHPICGHSEATLDRFIEWVTHEVGNCGGRRELSQMPTP